MNTTSLTGARAVVGLAFTLLVGVVQFGWASPCANPDFTLAIKSSGSGPHGVACGDFNQDGILDLAVANSDFANAGANGSVAVFLGHGASGIGDGTFASPILTSIAGSPFALITVDLDRDGHLDLVTANRNSGTVSILRGRGDGTFAAPIQVSASGFAFALTSGDFNADGVPDLAVVGNDCPSGRVTILLGQSAGPGDIRFAAPRGFSVGCYPSAIAAGDFNHDGILDLAVTIYDSGQIQMLLGGSTGGIADGTFTFAGLTPAGSSPFDIQAVDLDQDGLLDLVVACSSGNTAGTCVLRGLPPGAPGDPLFAPAVRYPAAVASYLAVADFDGDGVLDIAANGPTLGLLIGGKNASGPTGTFTFHSTSIGAPGEFGLVSADFNRDGNPDLACGVYNSGALAIELRACRDAVGPPPAPITGWGTNGIPVCVAGGSQQSPAVLGLPDQGGIVTWQDGRSLTDFDIYAQRLDSNGHPKWALNGVPVCVATSDQVAPVIARDGADGAFIAWVDSRPNGVFMTHIDGTGAIVSGWPATGLALGGNRMSQVKLVSDGTGGALVLTSGLCPGCTQTTQLTSYHVLADGTFYAGTTVAGIQIVVGGSSIGYLASVDYPLMVPNSTGGAHVGWRWSQGSCDMHCVYYDGGGFSGLNGAEQIVYGPSGLGSDYVAPGLIADGFGGAYDLALSNSILIARRVGSSGGVIWSAAISGSSPKYLPIGAPDGQGGTLITWIDQRSGGSDLYGVHMNGDGTLRPGWIADGSPISAGVGSRARVQMVPNGLGGAFLAWDDQRGSGRDIYATYLDPEGPNAPGWAANGTPVCTVAGDQLSVAMDAIPGAGAVLAWQDGRSGSGDIYAQRLSSDVATSTALALQSVVFADGQVRLMWAGDRPAARISVSRSRDGSAWSLLGSPNESEPGTLRYDDADVAPGQRCGYRLVDGAGAPIVGTDAWITVPIRVSLSLGEAWPNPVSGRRLTFRAGLETAEPARIDWTDISGRRVASQPIRDAGPGWQQASLDVPSLSPGVYWLVLRQGARAARRQVVLLR